MSRIDEALRRAAGQVASEEAPVPETPGPLVGAGIQELAEEPFPIEITDRRRLRGQTAPPGPATAGPPPPEPKPFEAEPVEEETQPTDRSRLFERIDHKLAEKVVADQNMSPVSREQYRRLAALLHDAQTSNGLKVVMIASAVPGEGKTLTASNLALTLSESYRQRVLLIDADLRKPTLHQVFQLHAASGLIEGLMSENGAQDGAPPGVAAALGSAGRPPDVGPDGRSHIRTDATADSGSARVVRLGDHRHAATPAAAGCQPVDDDGGRRRPHRPGELDAASSKSSARPTSSAVNTITGVVLNQAEATSQSGYGNHYYHGYYLTDKPSAGKS